MAKSPTLRVNLISSPELPFVFDAEFLVLQLMDLNKSDVRAARFSFLQVDFCFLPFQQPDRFAGEFTAVGLKP